MLPTSSKPTGHQRIRRATLRSAAKLLHAAPTPHTGPCDHPTSRTTCANCDTTLTAGQHPSCNTTPDHTHDWTGEDTTPGAHCATCGLTYLGTSGGTPIYTHPDISPLQGATFQPIGTHLPP